MLLGSFHTGSLGSMTYEIKEEKDFPYRCASFPLIRFLNGLDRARTYHRYGSGIQDAAT